MKYEIIKSKNFLLLAFITSVYTLLPHIMYGRSAKTLFVFVFLLFLLAKISRLLFGLVSFVLMILGILFIHVYSHWGGAFGHDVVVRIETAQMSPPGEMIEYLKNYLGIVDLGMFVYMLIGMFLIYNIFRYEYSLRKIRIFALILFPVFLILIIHYRDPFIKVPPFNYVYKYIEAGKWKKVVKERKAYLKAYKKRAKTNKIGSSIYDKIVIIIGESASKNHMSLYGYSQHTTPFFDLLKNQKGFYAFNAIAPANQTLYAVTTALTDANITDFYQKFMHSPSIVTKLKTYGYDKTYWLSNQSSSGGVEGYIVSMANEADHTKILNNVNWKDLVRMDEELLTYFDTLSHKEKKEAYFFHLLGSHVDYAQRYDSKHALFTHPNTIVEEYDNSIYYTDYILKEIYNRFKNEKVLFVYFSDHGEVVSDTKHGHNFSPSYRDEYEIPFVIYSSIPNKKLDDLQRLNANKKINLESLPKLIDYALGTNTDLSTISTNTHVMLMEPQSKLELQNNDYNRLKYYSHSFPLHK